MGNGVQADAKLVHSLDVMSSFSALGVEVPLTASAAPAAIAALSERKAHYLEKRAEVRLARHHRHFITLPFGRPAAVCWPAPEVWSAHACACTRSHEPGRGGARPELWEPLCGPSGMVERLAPAAAVSCAVCPLNVYCTAASPVAAYFVCSAARGKASQEAPHSALWNHHARCLVVVQRCVTPQQLQGVLWTMGWQPIVLLYLMRVLAEAELSLHIFLQLKESGVLPGDEGLAAESRSRANGHATPSALAFPWLHMHWHLACIH